MLTSRLASFECGVLSMHSKVFVLPKSASGIRVVPLVDNLRTILKAERGEPDKLCFGADGVTPFVHQTVMRRARKAWKAAELEPVTLHDCRHTFASYLIAAGVNPKGVMTYMGHASIAITFDRYGHLFPGNEDEAAALVASYLAERVEGVPGPVAGPAG